MSHYVEMFACGIHIRTQCRCMGPKQTKISAEPCSICPQKRATKGRRAFTAYPIRTCRTLHECYICRKDIVLGQMYFDGGYGRRAHVDCTNSGHDSDGAAFR